MADFWRGREVLITGGTGFLGQHLAKRLWAMDAHVWPVGRADGDLRDPDEVYNIFTRLSPGAIIFHLAATVGGIGANRDRPADFIYDNLLINTNVVNATSWIENAKLITVGSVCAYPKHCPAPFREENLFTGYPEETNAPYGITKRALLVQVQAYREQYGLDGIHLIPTNLYGPGDHIDLDTSHVIPALIRKMLEAKQDTVEIWGTGRATRDFLYVEDCVEALCLAGAELNDPIPMNLGSGQEVTVAALANEIKRLTGYQGQLVFNPKMPDGQPRRVLYTNYATLALGWRATTSLEDGLKATIAWMREVL